MKNSSFFTIHVILLAKTWTAYGCDKYLQFLPISLTNADIRNNSWLAFIIYIFKFSCKCDLYILIYLFHSTLHITRIIKAQLCGRGLSAGLTPGHPNANQSVKTFITNAKYDINTQTISAMQRFNYTSSAMSSTGMTERLET